MGEDKNPGGYLVGRRHTNGGIKAINKSTGQPLEMEGGEVVITRDAVNDPTPRSFNGKQMTNRQILSEINASGGGVRFAEGGEVPESMMFDETEYEFGGEILKAHQIAMYYALGGVNEDKDKDDYFGLKGHVHSSPLDNMPQNPGAPYYVKIEKSWNRKYYRIKGDMPKDLAEKIGDNLTQEAINYGISKGIAYSPLQLKYPNDVHYSTDDEGKRIFVSDSIEDVKNWLQLYKDYVYTDTNLEKLEQGGLLSKKEITKEANEHAGTFKRIKKGEIKTPADLGQSIAEEHLQAALTPEERRLLCAFSSDTEGTLHIAYAHNEDEIQNLVKMGLVYATPYHGALYVGRDRLLEIKPTRAGKQFARELAYTDEDRQPHKFKKGGEVEPVSAELSGKYKYFKGIHASYANPYDLNRAIEELLNEHTSDTDWDSDMKKFIRYYSGYGGLTKYFDSIQKQDKGILWEFFTPAEIAQRMWGLAYKHGYDTNSAVLEPSVGIGEFLQYAPDLSKCTGFEINPYSARICRLLYPKATIEQKPFERNFIVNNDSIKGKTQNLKKYGLIIGNPPYGTFSGREAGMGEANYTRAKNYIEYFIRRGLDILQPKGLLIFIIGAEVANGGVPFLDQDITPVKKEIIEMADLLDAYRLPNGVFERTDVLTDIIVLQKK